MRSKEEKNIQKALSSFVKYQYPKVLFNSDASGLTLTFGQAKMLRSLRSDNGYPDFWLYWRVR